MIGRMSRFCWLPVALLFLTAAPPAPASGTTVKDLDGEVQISVPTGWVRHIAPTGARSVQMDNATHDAFIVLTHIRKEDSTFKDLKACAEVSFRNDFNNGRAQNSHVTGPKSITVNGHPALQYEQTCTWAELRVVMVRTYVELDGSWNVIICASRPSDAKTIRPEFDRIIESFEDIGAAALKAATQPAIDARL